MPPKPEVSISGSLRLEMWREPNYGIQRTVVFPRLLDTSRRFLGSVLLRCVVFVCLVRSLVVVIDPVRDHAEGVVAVLESVQPHALSLQASKEALDHPVLLRRVQDDVL